MPAIGLYRTYGFANLIRANVFALSLKIPALSDTRKEILSRHQRGNVGKEP